MGSKATGFVHIPGDPRGWAPFEYLFRSRQSFVEVYDPAQQGGLVFCPTRRKLPIGFPVRVLVRLGRRRPPLVLQGRVTWRRQGRHAEKIRAGVGVSFTPEDQTKIAYILDAAAAGDPVKSRRRHERVPLTLPVRWRTEDMQEDLAGILKDIGRGGAFVVTPHPVNSDASIILELAAPGAAIATSVAGRVAWTGGTGEDSGFGLEWRARDAGGGRRIRELVRRLTSNA